MLIWAPMSLSTQIKNSAKLTPCQATALVALESDRNVFITGGAGSGKSFLIRHFLKGQDSKDFPVLASTGAAAVLVGGRTFHSFFSLGIMEGGTEQTIEKACRKRDVVRRIKKVRGFIVDEVSMLSGETLHAAEIICRRIRDSDLPWGGLRVVAVGDFAQLPPVERQAYGARAQKGWAFLHPVWEWSGFQTEYLRTQVRCRDNEYMKILSYVRSGLVNTEVTDYLNSKTAANSGADPEAFEGTRLFPRRDQTDKFNLAKLAELPGKTHDFETIFSGEGRAIEQLRKYAPIPDMLSIKIDALVMIRQNDPQGRWVNGSTGHIESISALKLRIRLLNGRTADIEKASFSLMDADGKTTAAAMNFPVTLAYASTIHKAQGATLDKLWVDLRSLWEPGQAYVALSRIVMGQDLTIENWQPASIKVDPQVASFYRNAVARATQPMPEALAESLSGAFPGTDQ
jgi:ATP-dependent DNA helicase PIF1